MKNGVFFDTIHSIDSWDLIMTSKIISDPEPKIIEVDIPGSDGVKDLTEAFGKVFYNNRIITINFDLLTDYNNWSEIRRKISNFLNGRKRKITFDIDSDFYYVGRCKITSFYNESTIMKITIECNCNPYKYKKEETVIEYDVIENNIYSFDNLFKEVVPLIEVSNALTIEFEGNHYSISPGSHKVLDIILKEGKNDFKVITGNGKLKLSYQEATL